MRSGARRLRLGNDARDSMEHTQQEDILSMLAHVVVADYVVRPAEIQAFIEGARRLNLRADNGTRRSRKWLLDWFNSALPRIKTEATNNNVHEIWHRKLTRLAAMDTKQHILDQMNEISNASGRPHTNEQLLLALAAGHWDIRSPVRFDATG